MLLLECSQFLLFNPEVVNKQLLADDKSQRSPESVPDRLSWIRPGEIPVGPIIRPQLPHCASEETSVRILLRAHQVSTQHHVYPRHRIQQMLCFGAGVSNACTLDEGAIDQQADNPFVFNLVKRTYQGPYDNLAFKYSHSRHEEA
jgi:hypothetical protein